MEEGVRREDLRTFPAGVALPLYDALHLARRHATVPVLGVGGRGGGREGGRVEAYRLIGREDLAALQTESYSSSPSSSSSSSSAPPTTAAAAAAAASAAAGGAGAAGGVAGGAAGGKKGKKRGGRAGGKEEEDEETALMADRDGLRLVEEEAVLRFGRDHRMREVCRVLRSSRPVFLKVRKEGGREGGREGGGGGGAAIWEGSSDERSG